MELGNQVLNIIATLKEKNQMIFSHEKDYSSDYEALKFTTTIDGLNYKVETFKEILPHWKDSGTKGDFLHSVTVSDGNNNTVAKISATYGGSYQLYQQDHNLINLDKLTSLTNDLEVLPKKDMEQEKTAILNNIKTIRNNAPKVESTYGLKLDWK